MNKIIKALASDVDGTLTYPERKILVCEAVEMIRIAERRGIPVFLVSGRSRNELETISTVIGTSGPLVCESGSIISDFRRDKILAQRTTGALKILEREIRRLRLGWIEPKECSITVHLSRDSLFFIPPDARPKLEALRSRIDFLIAKLDLFDLRTEIAESCVNVTHSSVNKGAGIAKATRLRRLSPRSLAAIGDSDNDIPLFRKCGYSIAVANASPCLKAVASFVTRRPSGLGAAEAIRHVLRHLT